MSEDVNGDVISLLKVSLKDLQSEELGRRKVALQQLKKILFDDETKLSKTTYQTAFTMCHMQVLKCFRDKSEMCREISIQIMFNFIQNLDLNDFYLTYIFPVIVERIGSVELIEESEELRLELVNFLISIVQKYSKTEYLLQFLSDIIQILCQTVGDKYPKVKEASCRCIMELAEAMPKHFHMQCENLVKPVLKVFTHQHFRIRVIAVKTIGVIILHSTGSSIIETTVGPLAERLFDQTAAVRQAVSQVAAQLLTEYRDRYSHFHRLLPLILTGLCDEVPETRLEVEASWKQVGAQYEKENEKELKDQLDFLITAPEHYPTDMSRPILGCRVLVQRNASKMIGALSSELTSWQDDVRIRCAQLLCIIVLHSEEFITQSLQDVLPAMYNACEFHRDQEKAVHENIMRAAKLIGVFVPVKAWINLVLPATADSPSCGHLRILRAMASGTPPGDIHQVATEIADLLTSKDIRCNNRKPIYLTELVECCRTITSFAEVSAQVFTTLVTVVALSGTPGGGGIGDCSMVAEPARELLKDVEGPERHVGVVLGMLMEEDAAFGNLLSVDRCIFDTLLLEWSDSLLPNLNLISVILHRALDEQCDPEARLKTFQSLTIFLQNNTLTQAISTDEEVKEFVLQLIKEILMPALIWRAGRTAEALRTAASCCLIYTLPLAPLPLITTSEDFSTILSTLSTLTDDASWRTRVYGCRSLSQLARLLVDDETKKKKLINESVIVLLKRLDDPNHSVRIEAMKSLKSVAEEGKLIEKQNLRLLVDSVLTHVDDQDDDARQNAIDILQTVSIGDSIYLNEKLLKDKHLFKNKDLCEELIEYLQALKTT